VNPAARRAAAALGGLGVALAVIFTATAYAARAGDAALRLAGPSAAEREAAAAKAELLWQALHARTGGAGATEAVSRPRGRPRGEEVSENGSCSRPSPR
jgi:hypothetical protein